MSRAMTPAQKAARTRKRNAELDALCAAYFSKFPGWGGRVTPAVLRAMRVAIKTGIDQPILIDIRKHSAAEYARNSAAYDARLAAEHAAPFTAELERHYTTRIKSRRLIEGDCERPWQNYFGYRAAHPKEVEPLDATDLAYAAQWTSCAIAKPAARAL
jgi:hypothetical protein